MVFIFENIVLINCLIMGYRTCETVVLTYDPKTPVYFESIFVHIIIHTGCPNFRKIPSTILVLITISLIVLNMLIKVSKFLKFCSAKPWPSKFSLKIDYSDLMNIQESILTRNYSYLNGIRARGLDLAKRNY